MDVDNIATVMAPSILSSTSNEYSKDELILSISILKSVIIHQNKLWSVPLSITNILSRLGSEDIEKNSVSTSQEIIREYRREILRRQNQMPLDDITYSTD